MNALGIDLIGDTVVMKADYTVLMQSDRRKERTSLLLAVPVENAGGGALKGGERHMLFGYWLEDGQYTCVDGRDIERLAVPQDIADMPQPPRCIKCNGAGSFGEIPCPTCGSTGNYTPHVPILPYVLQDAL
jgi:hypothetical protein